MRKEFIELYKKIYDLNEPLVLEPLGIKFKDLKKETLAAILIGLLDLKETRHNVDEVEFDVNRQLEIYQTLKEVKDLKLTRIGLIGKDAKKAFNYINSNYEIYEKGAIKTITMEEEIYLSVVECKNLRKNLQEFDLMVFYIESNYIYYLDNNKLLKENLIVQEDITNFYNLTAYLSSSELNYLFSLISSYGFLPDEVLTMSVILELDEKHQEEIIKNINTVFVKSLFNYYFEGPKKIVNVHLLNIKTLLNNYSLEQLKDLSAKEAVKVFLKW